jgi:hypothetical protein
MMPTTLIVMADAATHALGYPILGVFDEVTTCDGYVRGVSP